MQSTPAQVTSKHRWTKTFLFCHALLRSFKLFARKSLLFGGRANSTCCPSLIRGNEPALRNNACWLRNATQAEALYDELIVSSAKRHPRVYLSERYCTSLPLWTTGPTFFYECEANTKFETHQYRAFALNTNSYE